MSGKAKMRCARCHKPFKASSAKQTLCADCEAKERRARAVARATPTTAAAAAPAVKPKIVGPGANILVPGLVPPSPPPSPPSAAAPPTAAPPDGRAARDAQAGTYRPQQAAEHEHEYGYSSGGSGAGRAYPHAHSHPQQQAHGGAASYGRPRPPQRGGPSRPPGPPRPRKEPAPVITLTAELRERIERRYRELAQPVEFDGIRTRIAAELAVPKSLVKKAVLELRQRDQMPSWWELQGFHGSEEELEHIRAAYTPHLPLPAVGVHKQLATTLGLDPGAVYQAIRRIRAEMRLPQYNPPESHVAEADGADGASAENTENAQSVPTPAHAGATTPAPASALATPQAPETPAG